MYGTSSPGNRQPWHSVVPSGVHAWRAQATCRWGDCEVARRRRAPSLSRNSDGPRHSLSALSTLGALSLGLCVKASGQRGRLARRRAAANADVPQWTFEGRVWFRPAIVQCPPAPPAAQVSFLSLFGWTLGGTVCLEYDVSPCGAYREVVDMGSLVLGRGGALGQWGSRLCVSSKEAEVLCQQVWQVPAEERTIYFEDFEGGEALRCSVSDGDVVRVLGWEALRLCDGAEGPGVTLSLEGRLPLWWTPAIKALWLPLRVGDGPSPEEPDEGALNLHRLFLSASRVALQWRWPGDDKATTGPADGWPLPLSILADGRLDLDMVGRGGLRA
ncbi:unnamed protein product, partial [Symbiodinium sp. CCMP2456]